MGQGNIIFLSRHTSYRHLHSYMDPDHIHLLREFYPDARDIDLFVGILQEARRTRGAGSILGVTASCIIADQFQRLKRADFFWYESEGTPASFTRGEFMRALLCLFTLQKISHNRA